MDFKTNKPIYQQIIDFCFSNILAGNWTAGNRVPSVRELSIQLAVNSHTVLKAYEYLQAEEIIIPRRGLGFFLVEDAGVKVLDAKREEFYETTLHEVFEQMKMLGITIDNVVEKWKEIEN